MNNASPISEYNPPKQYWQARPIILYEWCYEAKISTQESINGQTCTPASWQSVGTLLYVLKSPSFIFEPAVALVKSFGTFSQ